MTTTAKSPVSSAESKFEVGAIRRDFPILAQRVHNKPIIYFDNAATTQKPQVVIDAERRYYETTNANIHRAVHTLAQRATSAYEESRVAISQFINAPEPAECIFTRGTTEAINLVASSLSQIHLKAGDEILLTELEHHSNIVPWQLAAQRHGAKIVAAPVNDVGEIVLDEFAKRLSGRTKVVAFSHVSNALGTINPVHEMIRLVRAKAPNAVVFVDGAQWVAHGRTDVQAIGSDFYCFSGHKIYGPTGIGILWGNRRWLDAMPPYQGGGDMIETVAFEKTTYAPLPNKFEAGTPNIAGVVGLAVAIQYVQRIRFDAIAAHEHQLLDHATRRMIEVPDLRIVGTARQKAAVISFIMEGVSSLDVGLKLDAAGVAVRTGHHCCMPLMNRYRLMEGGGTVRASFAVYNTVEEIDHMIDALQDISSSHLGAAPREKQIEFASRYAASPTDAADKLAEDFMLFEASNEKNDYVLELGAKLPRYFDELKKLTTRVSGCMSEVYVVARRDPSGEDRLQFVADANAEIVRGLIAILEKLYNGQRAVDVLRFDVEAFFRRIGLDSFISSQRRNGLAGMVGKIRSHAAQIAEAKS